MPFPFFLGLKPPCLKRIPGRSPGIVASLALLLAVIAANPAAATSVVPPEFSELVNESSYIVRAVVKSVNPEERTNAKGYRQIYSKVELEVKEVVAGRPPSPLVLQVLGGSIGGRELSIAGAPKFVVGDESILFVQNNGHQVYPLVRMMHGMYRIKKHPGLAREQVTRSDGTPLRDTHEVSGPLADHSATTTVAVGTRAAPALTPDEFIQKIRSAVTKPELRER
jgi:hypothetical protein